MDANCVCSAPAVRRLTPKECRHDHPSRKVLQGRSRPGPDQEVRLHEPDGSAAPVQDHDQHGRRRSRDQQEDPGKRRRRPDQDRRPEADRDEEPRVGGFVQDPRRLADRLQGHAAPRADVRVPRPPGQRLAAARPRLPRRVGSFVRRPWQLQHGREGTDHLPGNRLRRRSTRSAAWISPSRPPPRPTPKPRRCSKRSASRSATDFERHRPWPRPQWSTAKSSGRS